MEATKVQVPVVRCPTCDVPYVLRYSISFGTGEEEWRYQRDCKHKVSTWPANYEANERASLVAFVATADSGVVR